MAIDVLGMLEQIVERMVTVKSLSLNRYYPHQYGFRHGHSILLKLSDK